MTTTCMTATYMTPQDRITTCFESFQSSNGKVSVVKQWLVLLRDGGSEIIGLCSQMTPTQAKRMVYVRFGRIPVSL